VIDCHGRELIGWEFALRALGTACIRRFGILRVERNGPVLRSDNGLVFLSKRFGSACKFYRPRQRSLSPLIPLSRMGREKTGLSGITRNNPISLWGT